MLHGHVLRCVPPFRRIAGLPATWYKLLNLLNLLNRPGYAWRTACVPGILLSTARIPGTLCVTT
jgi:hypothetical protein